MARSDDNQFYAFLGLLCALISICFAFLLENEFFIVISDI